jgi:macrolide transport system ATP-binding/permease protein
MGISEAAALARQVTADTNNLQALWLSIAIPLSGAWAGCGGAAVIITLVLALSGTTTWLTALWWGVGNMALCALLLVVAYRGLGRLNGYALTLRRADFRYSEALGTARAAGPALRLLGHDEAVEAEAVATGREREIAAEALRRAEWVLTTALSALGLLGSVLAIALWHQAAAGHRSSLGLVALVGSFVVSLVPLELAGLLSRSVRSALSVTSITERLAEVMTEDPRPSRDEEVALPATSRLVCLTGPSGAGKSTYLAALCTITDLPFDDTVGGDLARQIARAAERGEVTWVPTESYWLDGFARDVAMVNPGDEDRARDIFEQLALPLDLRASWATLSRGEQSRAAVARGLLHASSVLVLDEPTHALDDHSAALVATALRRFRGVVIVATHDPRLLEMADEVWTIATR